MYWWWQWWLHTSDVDVWSAKFIHFVIITAYQVPLLPQGLLENRDAYVRWSENKLYLRKLIFRENFWTFQPNCQCSFPFLLIFYAWVPLWIVWMCTLTTFVSSSPSFLCNFWWYRGNSRCDMYGDMTEIGIMAVKVRNALCSLMKIYDLEEYLWCPTW